MNEIEVKIIDIDRGEVEKRLLSLGARMIFDGEMHALYFDFQDRTLGKAQDVLRLRKEGRKSILAFKKFISDDQAKIRREFEVEVSDFETTKAIIESIGLSPWLDMRKHRTTYVLFDSHFELDKYFGSFDYIPWFLEIEAPDLETIYRYAELLGFRKEDCKPWTSLELADHYSLKK
jgi:adenylate cyclase class 2